jgi:hypothetical protein
LKSKAFFLFHNNRYSRYPLIAAVRCAGGTPDTRFDGAEDYPVKRGDTLTNITPSHYSGYNGY